MAVALAGALLFSCDRARLGGGDAGEDAAQEEPAAQEADVVDDDGGPGEAPDVDPDAPADAPVEPADDEAGEDPAEEEPLPPRVVTCADEPPPGSDLPDPLPAYEGTCPALVPGRNTITSSGDERRFLLAVPAGLDPAERLPVAFLWHWLGGDANGFFEKGQVQAAADQARFLAIAPEAKGDLLMKWPFLLSDGAPRMEKEARFFDDMLACAAEQFRVNESCVSSVGVSSGALWADQLAQLRSRRLASFLSLSGGVGAPGDWLNPVHTWNGAAHKLPAVVLWGGPLDFCGLTFQTVSGHLEDALVAGGHFFVECVHNCAHAEPPLETPPGESKYSMLWTFIFDHPYWLRDGESPYLVTGLPGAFPAWCGIGPGSATIRTGECDSGLLGQCL